MSDLGLQLAAAHKKQRLHYNLNTVKISIYRDGFKTPSTAIK